MATSKVISDHHSPAPPGEMTASRTAGPRAEFASEHTPTPTLWVTPKGKVLEGNLAATSLFGVDPLERSLGDLLSSITAEQWQRTWQGLERTGTYHLEARFHDDARLLIPVEIDAFRVEARESSEACLFIRRSTADTERSPNSQHAEDLAFLTETSMALLEASSTDDLIHFIGLKVRNLVGSTAVVVVTEYDEENDQFKGRTIQGLGAALEYIHRMLGQDPQTMTVRLAPEVRGELTKRRLARIDGGIRALSGYVIRPGIARAIERFLGFGEIWAMGFVRDGRLFGNVAIVLRRGEHLRNRQLIEAFIGQAAVTLERQYAEAEGACLQAQLRHSQKMEALGLLAGGVAHDFNNLLTAIIGTTDLLIEESKPESDLRNNIEVIEMAAHRASELTRQLLGFARKDKLREKPVNLGEVMKNTRELLLRTIDKRITIELVRERKPTLVRGDRSQIEQVVMNLAVNARDAMTKGGRMTLSTRRLSLAPGTAPPAPGLEVGQWIVLSVSDTGIGMSTDVQQRAFEPFFTTKGDAEGTGMGLAMVYGIVRNHGGTVQVESTEGRGTTFDVFLPASNERDPHHQRIRMTPLPEHIGTILVIDDEPMILSVVVRMLERVGHNVISATSGRDGLAWITRQKEKTDLVLLDVNMPEMDGHECFQRLRALEPNLDVLITTGYAAEETGHDLVEQGARGVVQKPFVMAELLDAVSAVLDRKAMIPSTDTPQE